MESSSKEPASISSFPTSSTTRNCLPNVMLSSKSFGAQFLPWLMILPTLSFKVIFDVNIRGAFGCEKIYIFLLKMKTQERISTTKTTRKPWTISMMSWMPGRIWPLFSCPTDILNVRPSASLGSNILSAWTRFYSSIDMFALNKCLSTRVS